MKTSVILVAALLAGFGVSQAQVPRPPQEFGISGRVGHYPVGVDLIVEGGEVVSGHYFYASRLTDIPLRQTAGVDPLTLSGSDGSIFHLRFVGNGSEHGAPLTFSNSVGLTGSWTQGGKVLPAKLGFESAGPAEAPGHRYAVITEAPDSVVEAKARQFLRGVLSGDRDAATAAVSYPLRVNEAGGRRLVLRDRSALLAHWNTIFTPRYLAVLKTAVPHDMFVRDQGAMVASGAVWFDEHGATSLNLNM